MVNQEETKIVKKYVLNIKNFFKDLKNRIIDNWVFILIALVVFFSLIFVNNVFDYNSYFLNVTKYNYKLEGGRTPIIEKDVVVKQNFISQKDNLCKIGVYSLMPSISTNSTVNVKVLDIEKNKIILDQNVFLSSLKNYDYFEFGVETQEDSKGKEYQVIITGVDGNQFNSVQFPYSIEKSDYLTGCYVGDELQENNLLVKVSFNNSMGPKKVLFLLGIVFIFIMILAIYGIDKKTLKKDCLFLIFSIILGFITCVFISVYSKMGDFIFINLFKDKIGIITYLLTIILGTIYYFIFKNLEKRKIKPEIIFLIISLPIGLLYCMATPFGKVPDEITHAEKALDISYGNFLSKANEKGEAELTFTEKLDETFSLDNKTYNDYFEAINRESNNEKEVYKFSNMALYSPICHLSQAIGIFITRILGASLIVQLYAGRIANMIVAIWLIYFAVKYIPFNKILIILISLLPISMQEITSLSSDALTIAISLFYISYIMHIRYNNNIQELTKKDWCILIISSLIVSMCKIVYLPLCLLLFLIPESKLKSRKNKILKLGTLFIGVTILNLLWIAFSSRFLIEYNVGVNSKEQVLFILKNPIEYLLILVRTILMFSQSWWMGLVGTDLSIWGLETIDITYIASFSLSVILLILFFVNENKEIKIDKITKIICGIIFVSVVILIFTSIFVQFNKVSNTQISGIQPRYFIPLLLLVPIIFSNNTLIFNKKIDYKYLYMYIIFLSIHTLSIIINTYII